jgi:hypothetical protein
LTSRGFYVKCSGKISFFENLKGGEVLSFLQLIKIYLEEDEMKIGTNLGDALAKASKIKKEGLEKLDPSQLGDRIKQIEIPKVSQESLRNSVALSKDQRQLGESAGEKIAEVLLGIDLIMADPQALEIEENLRTLQALKNALLETQNLIPDDPDIQRHTRFATCYALVKRTDATDTAAMERLFSHLLEAGSCKVFPREEIEKAKSQSQREWPIPGLKFFRGTAYKFPRAGNGRATRGQWRLEKAVEEKIYQHRESRAEVFAQAGRKNLAGLKKGWYGPYYLYGPPHDNRPEGHALIALRRSRRKDDPDIYVIEASGGLAWMERGLRTIRFSWFMSPKKIEEASLTEKEQAKANRLVRTIHALYYRWLDSKKKGDESSDSSEENGDQPVDAVVAEAMKKAGAKGMENLFAMTDQQILALPGIGKAKLARIRATQQSQVEA